MMSKQLLICVESPKSTPIDYRYIRKLLQNRYEFDPYDSIKPIFLGGKYKYNSNKVCKEIKEHTDNFFGETIVVFCFDSDDFTTHHDDNLFF